MSRPTRREKAVVFGVSALLLALFLVSVLAPGAVAVAALIVYVAVGGWLVLWLWRRARASPPP